MKIIPLQPNNFQVIHQAFAQIAWEKPIALFEQYYQEQERDERFCFVAYQDEIFSGYVTLLKNSKYHNFARQNIFEISDLNVLPAFRKQGIGTALIKKCEETAKNLKAQIGLGVGLTADYADALRLYLKLGYELDNLGIAYDGKTLNYGEKTIVDDELNLYLIRK